jgi:hypothetical protein
MSLPRTADPNILAFPFHTFEDSENGHHCGVATHPDRAKQQIQQCSQGLDHQKRLSHDRGGCRGRRFSCGNKLASFGAPTVDHHFGCLKEDGEIQGNREMLDVKNVIFEFSF